MSERQSTPIPPGVRVEPYPAHWRLYMPAGCETAVRSGDVIYASDVQILRLAMGESIAVLDLSGFDFTKPLPMTTRPESP